MSRIFITGYGAISAMANTADDHLPFLSGEKTAPAFAPSRYAYTSLKHPVAEVKADNETLRHIDNDLTVPDFHSRSTLLHLHAAKQALKMAGLVADRQPIDLVCATTGAGIEVTENNYQDLHSGPLFKNFITSTISTTIAQQLGLQGEIHMISTACSSSANAILLGARKIKAGLAKRVLVGGGDALSRFSLNGFNSLEILSANGCKPFDENRNGVTLGEAAAYLVLEDEESAKDKNILAEIVGYANTNEAFHPTASSAEGEGPLAAMQAALQLAQIQPSDIGYINAHGTGTIVNDLAEAVAIEKLFGNTTPVSSTKGITGHTLAGCGSLEAIFTLLALNHQQIWPNFNLQTPLKETNIHLTTNATSAAYQYAMSNSFGFGGNNTSIIFSRFNRP